MTIQDYFQNKIRLLGIPIIPENIDLFLESKGLDKDNQIDVFSIT